MPIASISSASDDFHAIALYRRALGINIQSKRYKPKNFSEKDFSKWVENGLIPFIDLKLWGLFEGSTFTQNVLGQAIFPTTTQIDTTERIRKATSPDAELMLQESFSRALQSQAIAMRVEQGKPALQSIMLMDIPL